MVMRETVEMLFAEGCLMKIESWIETVHTRTIHDGVGRTAALPSKPCYDARPEHPQRHARTTAACLKCVFGCRAL